MRAFVAALLWLCACATATAQRPADEQGSPFRALVPSAAEQLEARTHALESAIVRLVAALAGVRSAHAAVDLPERSSAPLDAPLPRAQVSLLLTLEPGTPFPKRAVLAELVTSVGRELAAADVHIAYTQAPANAQRAGQTLVAVGPFRVAAESAGPVRAALAASLLANVMLATLLLWRWRRTSRTRIFY